MVISYALLATNWQSVLSNPSKTKNGAKVVLSPLPSLHPKERWLLEGSQHWWNGTDRRQQQYCATLVE